MKKSVLQLFVLEAGKCMVLAPPSFQAEPKGGKRDKTGGVGLISDITAVAVRDHSWRAQSITAGRHLGRRVRQLVSCDHSQETEGDGYTLVSASSPFY